jgi:hypothetical protein
MAIIVSSNQSGTLSMFDTLGDAKTGRWCIPPEVPDRCNCFDPKTFRHGIATHYWVEKGRDGKTYRNGACRKCRPEGVRLYRIPNRSQL